MAVKFQHIGPSISKKNRICLRRLFNLYHGKSPLKHGPFGRICVFFTSSKHPTVANPSQYEQNGSKLRIPKEEPEVLSHWPSGLDAAGTKQTWCFGKKHAGEKMCANLTVLKAGFPKNPRLDPDYNGRV